MNIPANRAGNGAVIRAFLLVALLVLLPAVLLPASPAVASPAQPGTESAAAPAAGETAGTAEGPLFGAALEWGGDTAAGFAERLGATPAMFGHDIAFPLQESEKVHIREELLPALRRAIHAVTVEKRHALLNVTGA